MTPESKPTPWFCQECLREFQQVVLLKLIKDPDHLKCPVCGIEVWEPINRDPDPSKIKVEKSNKDLTRNQYISRSLPEGYQIPPGGSKSGKRAKKKGTKTFIDNGYEGFLK